MPIQLLRKYSLCFVACVAASFLVLWFAGPVPIPTANRGNAKNTDIEASVKTLAVQVDAQAKLIVALQQQLLVAAVPQSPSYDTPTTAASEGGAGGIIKRTQRNQKTTAPTTTITAAWADARISLGPPDRLLPPNVESSPVCSWQADPAPFLWESTAASTAKASKHHSALAFLTDVWGLTFTLDEGSLVGAFRQRGPTDCDIDLDVALPVWLNTRWVAKCLGQPSLHCADADERPLPRRTCQNCGPGKKLLCGISRGAWLSKFHQCFTKLMSTHPKRKDGPNTMEKSKNGAFLHFGKASQTGTLKIDMTISQIDARYGPGIDADYDRKVAKYGLPQDGVPCKCRYGTFDALCWDTETTHASLAEKYGAEFMWVVYCGLNKVNPAIFEGAQNLTRYQRLVAPVRQNKAVWLKKSSASAVSEFSIIAKKRY